MKTDKQVYAGAVGLGLLAGMRAMSAPALVSRIVRKQRLSLPGRLRFLGNSKSVTATALLAAGELIADKLPSTPNRTSAGPLIARAATGGVSGAIFCSAKKQSPWLGAMYGAMGALGAAYAAYYLRASIKDSLGLPDAIVAIAEDAIVASTSLLLASQFGEQAA